MKTERRDHQMKQFQRLAAFFAACALLTGTAALLPYEPVPAAAAVSAADTVEAAGIVYTLYADHAEVSRYTGESAAVTVPGSVRGVQVTAVADGAFAGTLVRHVELPESVSRIGAEAFAACERLVVCTFPEALTDIGRDAFRGTFWLNKQQKTSEPVTAGHVLIDASKCKGVVRLSEGITAIAPYAFSGNTALTGVRFSSGLKVIGEGAFSGCTAIKQLSIPKSVTKLPAEMCAGCSAMLGLILPDTLTEIGAGAFRETALEYLTLPESITDIAPEAFSGCGKLRGFTGMNVKRIGARAFAGCSLLSSADGVCNAEEIGEEAFAGCTGLQFFTETAMLRIIGPGAFRNCTGLHSVVLNAALSEIGDEAFAGCTGVGEFQVFSVFPSFGKNVLPDSPELTLYAYEGTSTMKYGEEAGVQILSLGEIYRAKPGDANGDNALSVEDAQLVLKVYTERLAGRAYSLPDALETAADVDEDGELTVKDAQYILRFYTEDVVARRNVSWQDILDME